MRRNAWIAMALVVLIVVLLVAAVLRSVGELGEIYDEDDDEEAGDLKPDLVKEDALGMATKGLKGAKIEQSGRSGEPRPLQSA
jgi:hypothetical protein